ncbi:MAG: hypothetical protein ACTMKU_03745, partial [Actinomycetaceae bacterium]
MRSTRRPVDADAPVGLAAGRSTPTHRSASSSAGHRRRSTDGGGQPSSSFAASPSDGASGPSDGT